MSQQLHKKACEIMLSTNDYPIIYEDETVKKALIKLQFSLCSPKAKRRNLLVLDRNDQPIGWINLRDLFAVLQPIAIANDYIGGWNINCFTVPATYFAQQLTNAAGLSRQGSLAKLCAQMDGVKINNFVRPLESASVHADTSLQTVAITMAENNISTLPVVEKGKLIGFIRAEDIIIEMAQSAINPINNHH